MIISGQNSGQIIIENFDVKRARTALFIFPSAFTLILCLYILFNQKSVSFYRSLINLTIKQKSQNLKH